MDFNVSNAFTIRIVPQRAVGDLRVSMTAVPSGTKVVFAAPLSEWDEYANQLKQVVGMRAETIMEATERLRIGFSAKVSVNCHVASMKQMGFELIQR